jgi:hypothetical protein
MSVPTDVELPKHSGASSAELHRIGENWTISFGGQDPFFQEEFTIPAGSLADAGVNPSLNRLVTGYVETRLLAAGYGISPREDKPPDVEGAWELRR